MYVTLLPFISFMSHSTVNYPSFNLCTLNIQLALQLSFHSFFFYFSVSIDRANHLNFSHILPAFLSPYRGESGVSLPQCKTRQKIDSRWVRGQPLLHQLEENVSPSQRIPGPSSTPLSPSLIDIPQFPSPCPLPCPPLNSLLLDYPGNFPAPEFHTPLLQTFSLGVKHLPMPLSPPAHKILGFHP